MSIIEFNCPKIFTLIPCHPFRSTASPAQVIDLSGI